jgi:hypothetical protein
MKGVTFRSAWVLSVVLIAALALSTIVWMGCGDQLGTPTEPQESQETIALAKGNPQLRAAMAVQNRHTRTLLAMRGVIGTATTRLPDGRYAVKILTKRAGLEASLPRSLDGFPVVVEAVGEVRALGFTGTYRPVPIGVSVGNIAECASGTIGAVVTKGGKMYFLSNNHVFARQNQARIGEDIVQPGRFDEDPQCNIDPSKVVADLAEFKRINFGRRAFQSPNVIDAAIAEIRPGTDFVCSTLTGYTPSSVPAMAHLGMSVKKTGRTTGLTTGTVTGVNVTIVVTYPKPALFVGQIQFTDIADPGDSGSLIVTNDSSNRPVALLFAGSDTATFGNPIGAVLENFGVTICDHNH